MIELLEAYLESRHDRRNLSEKREKDRRTNVYTLTRRGRREIEARRRWEYQYVEPAESAPA